MTVYLALTMFINVSSWKTLLCSILMCWS